MDHSWSARLVEARSVFDSNASASAIGTRLNENIAMWATFGLVSTAFFIHVLILISRVIRQGSSNMDGTPKKIFGAILPLFMISWWLYPIAYAAPLLLQSGVSYEFTIVSQQVIYTIADIASKVVYGVMLSVTATMLSSKQGYQTA